MYKLFLKITAIIFINLFAFLFFFIIFKEYFENKGLFLIGVLIASIIPLTFFLFFEIKKATKELNIISKKEKYDGKP